LFGSEEERPDMANKWVINLILLIVLVGASLVAFQSLKEEPKIIKGIEVTNLKLSEFDEIELNFPSKAKVHFKIIEDHWKILSPVKGRANERYVYQLLSILASRSPEKLKSDDLEKYGLDQPQLKLTFLNNEKSLKEEFVFGTYNPISENQYIKYKDDVFIVNGLFSETASYVPIEFIDKRPIAPYEMIQGFNFSRLEQWQKNQLKLVEKNGQWATKGINVSTTQEDIVEWLSVSWDGLQALSVESFKMDSRLGYKSFDVIVNDNKKVTFYKIQESPQLHLYRKDDGLLYRFPGDLGFTMLNPHVKVKEKE
jgi:hypothetical protein